MNSQICIMLCCIVVLISILLLRKHTPAVYCMMITGKDAKRLKFASISIHNFSLQTYQNKYMIVLNQSKHKLINKPQENILEIHVDSDQKKLGELRNIALQLVPPNAYWTTWDDDDWRHPQYIQKNMDEIVRNRADLLMFQNRIEYNLVNRFMFRSRMIQGTMIFFAKTNPYLQYENTNTSEDKVVKEYALKNLKTYIYNNDPTMYVRMIHDDNTSVYVTKNRESIKNTLNNRQYFEYNISEEEKKYVDNIIYKY